MLDKSFGHRLLVPNFVVIQRALGQNDLDAGSSAYSSLGLVATYFAVVSRGWKAFLDHQERVDLEDVPEAVSRDQGDRDSLVHTLIECLQCYRATTLEASHDEGDQLAHLRVLGDAHSCIDFLLRRGTSSRLIAGILGGIRLGCGEGRSSRGCIFT